MGDDYSILHAACLCVQLPPESRTVKALATPDQAEMLHWTLPVRIAVEQLNELRLVRWLNSSDAADGKNYPEPILPPEAKNYEPPKPDAAGYRAALDEIRARIRESNGGDERCQAQ